MNVILLYRRFITFGSRRPNEGSSGQANEGIIERGPGSVVERQAKANMHKHKRDCVLGMEEGLTTKASSADRIGDIVWPKVLVPVKFRSVGGRGDKLRINNNATGKREEKEEAGWLPQRKQPRMLRGEERRRVAVVGNV